MEIFTSLQDALNRHKNTVENDLFDQMEFRDITQQSQHLHDLHGGNYRYTDAKEEEENTERKLPTLPPLLEDTFNTLYKFQPRLLPDNTIQPDHLINKDIIQKIMKTEQYRTMRAITKGDKFNSAIATLHFVRNFLDQLARMKPETGQNLRDLQQLQNDLIKALADAESKNKNPDAEQKIHDIESQIQEKQKQIGGIPQLAVSTAVARANQEASETAKAVQAFGWGKGTGVLQQMDTRERMKLADALVRNRKLQQIVELLGSLKFLAVQKRREKIHHRSVELYDITLGDDLKRMLAAEAAYLTDEDLEVEWMRRFAERGLMEYDLKDRDTRARGGIVVCLDKSGSMSGDREIWSVAVALATLEICVRENRPYHLIMFTDGVENIYQFDRNMKPSLDNIIKIAGEHYGGGTDFEKALYEAQSIIEGQGGNRPDILFITDGMATISDDFKRWYMKSREGTDTNLVTVLIGRMGLAESMGLDDISDEMVDVENITRDTFGEHAKNVFGRLQ